MTDTRHGIIPHIDELISDEWDTVLSQVATFDMDAVPFEAGETLDTYAERLLRLAGHSGPISEIRIYQDRLDVTSYGWEFKQTKPRKTEIQIAYNERP